MATSLIRFASGFSQKLINISSPVSHPAVGLLSHKFSTVSGEMKVNTPQQYAPLPNLPVPKLQQTLDLYLRTVKPLLSDNEFTATSQATKNFGAPGGVGEKLQALLEAKGSKEPNWLGKWWLECAYLSYRLPVVVHSNPGLVLPKQNYASLNDQLAYAAKVIVGALNFKAIIDENKLKQDYLGKSPLDMSQYKKVFNVCRIPGEQIDSIHQAPTARHVVVAHNNHFFKLDVYTANGEIADESDILNSLSDIVRKSPTPSNEPVGILTTEHRDTWGTAYQKLSKDPVNRASLKSIADSIFVICLDKKSTLENKNIPLKSSMAMQMLHGSGSRNNSGNRWFDKTLQLIVGPDGINGLNYEHSPAEGPPIATLADYVLAFAQNKSAANRKGGNALKSELLPFKLSHPELRDYIETAKRNIDQLVNDVEVNWFTFEHFGKEDMKAIKSSPDSFIQIAIQMSYIRLHGKPTAHYESASTRKFTGGRTETIRTCLPEIVDFAKTHLNSIGQKTPAKYKALQSALKAHKDYVQAAIDGQAVDRHLLGLKLIAIENGIEVPEFYRDPGYSQSVTWRCSTSQVAGACDMVMCFGPVVPDGYGCCYNPRRDAINFAVSAFNSNPQTSARKFGEALQASLIEMRDIALANMNSKL